MQVFLVGFMGAGKSSLGKKLASKLNLSFLDLDEVIEKEQKMTVDEIFESKGEEHFRSLEKDWIFNLTDQAGVYALGGGTPCQDGIMELLREKGVPVYVKVAPGIIVSRLQSSETIRPLIAPFKDDKSQLMTYVQEKLQERQSFYLKSKIIFESSNMNAEKLELLADLISLSGS